MDYTNIPLGMRVQTQIPLDVKTYKASEADLKNLGTNNNLAFTYVKGMIIYCVLEGTRYEWKEMTSGETGLLDDNFIYPNNIVTFGINYSNKEYNFVKVDSSQTETNNIVHPLIINTTDLPENYTEQDISDYINTLPNEERTILETQSKWNILVVTMTS